MQRQQARALLDVYRRDLRLAERDDFIVEHGRAMTPSAQLEEMHGLAEQLGVASGDVVLGNLYYDALKTIWGCSAFVVDTADGPLHARNLDWWSVDRLLVDATLVTRWINGPAGPFITVGWPGLVGALSGSAAGRFSVSLNAVCSEDPAAVAMPVVSLVRLVLEEEPTFASAVHRLCTTEIASDALIVVAGVQQGEAVVIERSPTRVACRAPQLNRVCATNDYRALSHQRAASESALEQTSCRRFGRLEQLLARPPATLSDAIAVLRDDDVRLGITVQHMAFRAATNEHLVQLPDPSHRA